MAMRKAWLALQLTSPYEQDSLQFIFAERFNPALLTPIRGAVYQRNNLQ